MHQLGSLDVEIVCDDSPWMLMVLGDLSRGRNGIRRGVAVRLPWAIPGNPGVL